MSDKGILRRIKSVARFVLGLRGTVADLKTQSDAARWQIDQLQHAHDALAVRNQILENDHKASVDWLQKTYPEIVDAIGRKIEHEQLQQQTERLFQALHRELDNCRARQTLPADGAGSVAAAVPRLAANETIDDALYLELERSFRGACSEIARRQEPYLVYLTESVGKGLPVLDIGCGRGEWLGLLKSRGIYALGLDLNPVNGASCRHAGFNVVTANASDYLAAAPAHAFSAITAFQVVEHMAFPELVDLLKRSLNKLAPGGVLILETPNPENLLVATRSFWLDPTHQKPLPPELLEFVVRQTGFEIIDILRVNPHAELPPDAAPLEMLLHGPRDYAVIAKRPLTA